VANGDVDKAIAEFDEAIRFDPKFVEALSSRGIARHSKADLDRAIVDYTEAIRLHDKNRVVLCNRSSAWIEKKEYKKAVADGDAATRLDADWLSPFGCGRSHGQR